MRDRDARRELYSRLVELENAARTARISRGLKYSRRLVAQVAAKPPISTELSDRRISDWVPKDPEKAADAQVPYDSESAAFLAMVQVWSDWAGRKYQKNDWTALLADAHRERVAKGPSTVALRKTLPPLLHGFAGRADELDCVLDVLGSGSDGPTAVCVASPAGVGKTALALVAAHRAQERGWFTAALFVDLLGYQDSPADPADLLAVLLRGLDADVSVIGSSAEAGAAAYRARLADLARAQQPVLIVADNAADAAAVRPLLPSGPHRLLVTYRHTLHTLDARLIDLPVLPDDAAVELLATALVTGHRRHGTRVARGHRARAFERLSGHSTHDLTSRRRR